MIALDTNVLVRLLVQDDPSQSKKAAALIDRLEQSDERAYVSDIVLCELVWVLSRSYRYGRKQITPVLTKLLAAKQLRFDAVEQAHRALVAFEMGKGDFADYLVRKHAKIVDGNSPVGFR